MNYNEFEGRRKTKTTSDVNYKRCKKSALSLYQALETPYFMMYINSTPSFPNLYIPTNQSIHNAGKKGRNITRNRTCACDNKCFIDLIFFSGKSLSDLVFHPDSQNSNLFSFHCSASISVQKGYFRYYECGDD